jgi:hypothetical protein
MMLVHHDDAGREWSYGAGSKIGPFSDALMAEAKENGWIVISMKNDWGVVFPWGKQGKEHSRDARDLRLLTDQAGGLLTFSEQMQ